MIIDSNKIKCTSELEPLRNMKEKKLEFPQEKNSLSFVIYVVTINTSEQVDVLVTMRFRILQNYTNYDTIEMS